MSKYFWAHEDEIELDVRINWSEPVAFSDLFDGNIDEEEAYYYAIVGRAERVWKCFYIGKVYDQYVSTRHLNKDHIDRRKQLISEYPEADWCITLGVPKFNEKGRVTRNRVDVIEGLLIYSHWHDEIINKSKVNFFNSKKSIMISNRGFTEPFKTQVAYGVMVSN